MRLSLYLFFISLRREEVEPIGDGPQYNPDGQADVSSSLIGSYSITGDDYQRDPKYHRHALRHQ